MSERTAGGDAVLCQLESVAGPEYNNLEACWHDWDAIRAVCAQASTAIFDHACGMEER